MSKPESKDIVNYEDLLANMAKKAVVTERPAGTSISVRGGILSYNGNPAPGNKLPAIIIASVHANALYEGAFDANNLSSPICFAYGEDDEGMVPHEKSVSPQAESCADCPKNVWGSGKGRGKACKNGRTLALIPGNTSEENVASAELAILKLPVMSVNNWSTYTQKVAAVYRRPTMAVVTEISVVPDAKAQFKVGFDDIAVLDASMIPSVLARIPAALEACQKVYEPAPPPADEQANRKF